MAGMGAAPCLAVVAEDVRDLQSGTGHRPGLSPAASRRLHGLACNDIYAPFFEALPHEEHMLLELDRLTQSVSHVRELLKGS